MFYSIKMRLVILSLAMFALSVGCSGGKKPTTAENKTPKDIKSNVIQKIEATSKLAEGIDLNNEPIKPLALPENLDQKKVALGKLLFLDVRLSKDNTLSCASCHGLDKGGTDLTDVSTGVGGVKGPINSPTVFNSGNNIVQFWDGRAGTLEEQAAGPVHNPKEMASNWEEVLQKISGDENYKNQFVEIYPDGMTGKNIANAIAEFELSLVTVDSRFDHYLKGDASALNALEIQGYNYFKDYGCVACHNGANVGGNSFQKFGLVKDYFATKANVTEADNGRFNVTQDPNDKNKFKVPSLRLAALTPPYFHDASAKTLEEAVRVMGRYQLGIEFADEEVKAIVAFLKTLPGKYDGKMLYSESK